MPRKGCSWVLAIKRVVGGKKETRSYSSSPLLQSSLPCAVERRKNLDPKVSRPVAWCIALARCLGLWLSCTSGSGPSLDLPHMAGPCYSRATAGLIGEVAPELSLPPVASFSFLPLYWPMKEPSSLNWTSTLPP